MDHWVQWGVVFWLGVLGFWLLLWGVHVRNRLDTQAAMPYDDLRLTAWVLGVCPGAVIAVGLLQGRISVDHPFLGLAVGPLVGLAHFLVFPEAWWRARRGPLWWVD